ncbi:PIN domain-containing protein [Bradyrhizobium algeriense]|uniref:PIN domain-containing protein n=1 Tax=Bradyrhizobium algeriense TaxID=634784 RepID=UPI000D3BC7DA
MPRPVTGLLDANVLYSNALRNLLLQLALNDAFEARWTDRIEDEWLRNLEDRTRDRVSQRTLPLIRKHFPDAIICDFDADQAIGSTDPKARHVAGAAVAVQACALITNNLNDFDASELAKLGVRVLSPDVFSLSYSTKHRALSKPQHERRRPTLRRACLPGTLPTSSSERG